MVVPREVVYEKFRVPHIVKSYSRIPDVIPLPALVQIQVDSYKIFIEEGLREHFRPSARHLAEVRGLMNQMIRRMERIETDLLAERNARIDDLALLVDLISSGWRSANERLARNEAALEPHAGSSAVVYHIERPEQQAG